MWQEHLFITRSYIKPGKGLKKQEVLDRWNNWVFELEAEPRFEEEESRRDLALRSSVSATKITNDWKMEFDSDNRFSRTRYAYDDTIYTKDKSYQGFDLLVVKSLGEHWSTGLKSELLSSTYTNTRFSADLLPSIEYNVSRFGIHSSSASLVIQCGGLTQDV